MKTMQSIVIKGDMVAECIYHHSWHNLFVAGPAHSLEVADSNPARTTRVFLVGTVVSVCNRFTSCPQLKLLHLQQVK